MSTEADIVERLARASLAARRTFDMREGPYGVYNYESRGAKTHAHCVRDFRDTRSVDYGRIISRFKTHDEAMAVYHQLTEQHFIRAALAAVPEAATLLATEGDSHG